MDRLQDWWKSVKKSPENPHGWTTISLAKKIGRAQSIVSRILSRRHRPDPSTAIRLIKASDGALSMDDIYNVPERWRADHQKRDRN